MGPDVEHFHREVKIRHKDDTKLRIGHVLEAVVIPVILARHVDVHGLKHSHAVSIHLRISGCFI